MKTTPEKQVIKSMLALLDATPTNGEPISDALQKYARLHAETIRNLCQAYGVELDEPLPFGELHESIKHHAVQDGITTTNGTPAAYMHVGKDLRKQLDEAAENKIVK